MLKIRMARAGAKKKPFYHIVVTPDTSPRDGRFIERLGFFNPIVSGKAERLRLNTERISWWQKRGAQSTARVKRLLYEQNLGTDALLSYQEKKQQRKKQRAANRSGETAV